MFDGRRASNRSIIVKIICSLRSDLPTAKPPKAKCKRETFRTYSGYTFMQPAVMCTLSVLGGPGPDPKMDILVRVLIEASSVCVNGNRTQMKKRANGNLDEPNRERLRFQNGDLASIVNLTFRFGTGQDDLMIDHIPGMTKARRRR